MARVGHVSWLEAAMLAFPGRLPSGVGEQAFRGVRSDLSQWRGRAGLTPASVMTHPPNRIVEGT